LKPVLAICLGNPLMGDEGIGWHLAGPLAADPEVAARAEVVWGGSDLLRFAGGLEGRERIVVIDALADDSPPGTVSIFRDSLDALDDRQGQAHQLSAVAAIRLLQLSWVVPFTFIGISIREAATDAELSPALAAQMPAILERLRDYFRQSDTQEA